LEKLGTKKEETLVIGDRLETDIAAGQAVGCPTALVLSGVSTPEQAANWDPAPDVIVSDLSELIK
jgi:ribonucleotide monophosphatase NagD (HAD superfamily)